MRKRFSILAALCLLAMPMFVSPDYSNRKMSGPASAGVAYAGFTTVGGRADTEGGGTTDSTATPPTTPPDDGDTTTTNAASSMSSSTGAMFAWLVWSWLTTRF